MTNGDGSKGAVKGVKVREDDLRDHTSVTINERQFGHVFVNYYWFGNHNNYSMNFWNSLQKKSKVFI